MVSNFFYPLSALLMLLGCYTLSHALALAPGRLGGLAALMSTLHVYEILLIILALVVLSRLRLADDAASLVAIETLFLADASLLLNELLAADLAWGTTASAITIVLAGFKLAALARGTRLAPDRGLVAVSLQLLLVLAVPGLFAWALRWRQLEPGLVHLWWWGAAAASLGAWAVARGAVRVAAANEAAVRLRQWLMVVPGASLLVHLYAGGWVYDIPFRWANVAAVLMAAASAAALLPSPRRRLAWLPALAVLMTLDVPPDLVADALGVTVSPFRVVVGASAILYAVVFRRWRFLAAALASAACAATALAGHSVTAAARTFSRVFDTAAPRSAHEWGVALVALAFVSLAAGLAISVRKASAAKGATPSL